ncbi:hypothetical protein CPB85DRAFT_1441237 [Mucidula mucida]|nr:hypothetical protein CPB85DRAFT_1441237 [Mucidula mucida]
MASPDASASLPGSPNRSNASLLPGSTTPQNTNFVLEPRDEDEDVFLATPQDPNVQRTMGLQLPPIKPTPNIRDPIAEKRNSAATRARTAAAAPAGIRCVLTQEPNEKGGTVQAAHAIPRSWQKSVPDRIRNIEYHLGFPNAKMLNLDTRWNIMFLLVIYHLFYDHDGFIFLPAMEVINAIYDFTMKNLKLAAAKQKLVFYLTAFPTPPEGWQYSTVPVKMSAHHSIFRKIWRKVERNGKTEYEETAKYQRFKYPFHTLPLAHIHVNPCLMIISAWKTINKLPSHPIWTREQNLAVQTIRWIVNEWISPADPNFQPSPRVDRPFAHPRRAHNTRATAANNANAVAGPSTLPSTRQEEMDDENAAAGPSLQPAPLEDSSETTIPLRRSKRKLAVSDGKGGDMVAQASKRARND